jgi:hypothetical protein
LGQSLEQTSVMELASVAQAPGKADPQQP